MILPADTSRASVSANENLEFAQISHPEVLEGCLRSSFAINSLYIN
jgi:hypothetical protein